MIVGSTRDVMIALASWRELGEFTVRREMCDILVFGIVGLCFRIILLTL